MNTPLEPQAIAQLLSEFTQRDSPYELVEQSTPGGIRIPEEDLLEAMGFLYQAQELFFDQLACITAVDLGHEEGTVEVIYHLNSIPFGHQVAIYVQVTPPSKNLLPAIESVAQFWKTADWLERECYDLVGIQFKNHPDLRRILLPQDWEGYPLRKDYQEQEYYHGIKVAY
ncbi:MAG: NADH-quinone oxidoreductase subunit C [Bacteroidota bacterium]